MKWIIDLNVKTKTIKPTEENRGENIYDLGWFPGQDTQSLIIKLKINKLDFIKSKTSLFKTLLWKQKGKSHFEKMFTQYKSKKRHI